MVENFKMKGISISKTTVQVKKKAVPKYWYTGDHILAFPENTAAPRYILQYIPRHSPAPQYIPVYHQSGTLPTIHHLQVLLLCARAVPAVRVCTCPVHACAHYTETEHFSVSRDWASKFKKRRGFVLRRCDDCAAVGLAARDATSTILPDASRAIDWSPMSRS